MKLGFGTCMLAILGLVAVFMALPALAIADSPGEVLLLDKEQPVQSVVVDQMVLARDAGAIEQPLDNERSWPDRIDAPVAESVRKFDVYPPLRC